MSLISKGLAKKYGGISCRFRKSEFVFREGEEPVFYYQVDEGIVKMLSSSEAGHEFIQGVFFPGESFGEPALFKGFVYPASAYCLSACVITKIAKESFFRLLKDHFEIHLTLDRVLCQRLRYKNMLLAEVSFHRPEHRLATLLNYLRDTHGTQGESFEVPLTRQILADMTGLRVETVIRCIKRMAEQGKLEIAGHKVFLPANEPN